MRVVRQSFEFPARDKGTDGRVNGLFAVFDDLRIAFIATEEIPSNECETDDRQYSVAAASSLFSRDIPDRDKVFFHVFLETDRSILGFKRAWVDVRSDKKNPPYWAVVGPPRNRVRMNTPTPPDFLVKLLNDSFVPMLRNGWL